MGATRAWLVSGCDEAARQAAVEVVDLVLQQLVQVHAQAVDQGSPRLPPASREAERVLECQGEHILIRAGRAIASGCADRCIGDGMDIGKCLRDAWGLFKLDVGPLIVTAVIAAVIAGVVRLIIILATGASIASTSAGWFIGGIGVVSGFFASLLLAVVLVLVYAWFIATTLRMITRRVREHRAADFDDMADFSRIGAFAVAAVVLGIIIVIGYALLIIPGLIFTTFWLFTLPLMVDRGLGLGDAMTESQRLAREPGYLHTFAVWVVGAIVVAIVSSVLNSIPLIGPVLGLLTAPFAMAYVVSMYFQATGQGQVVDDALREGGA